MANLVLSECGIRPLPRIYTTPRSNFLSNNNKFRPSLSSSSYKTSSSPLSFGLNSRDGFTRNWALNVSTPLTTPIFEESPLEEDNKQRFDPGAPPPFNLADIRAAIPKHCWVKNPWKSLSYVVRDIAIVFALAAGAAYLNNWIVWPLYWLAQGTMFWALFVLGHDW